MRRSLIIFLVLAALAPTSAMASDWFRCHADGVAREECCCPDEDGDERDAGTPPTMAASSCCDVERIAARSADARLKLDPAAFAGLAIIPRTVIRVDVPPVDAVPIARVATTAQPRGPPLLYLQHCSLLC